MMTGRGRGRGRGKKQSPKKTSSLKFSSKQPSKQSSRKKKDPSPPPIPSGHESSSSHEEESDSRRSPSPTRSRFAYPESRASSPVGSLAGDVDGPGEEEDAAKKKTSKKNKKPHPSQWIAPPPRPASAWLSQDRAYMQQYQQLWNMPLPSPRPVVVLTASPATSEVLQRASKVLMDENTGAADASLSDLNSSGVTSFLKEFDTSRINLNTSALQRSRNTPPLPESDQDNDNKNKDRENK